MKSHMKTFKVDVSFEIALGAIKSNPNKIIKLPEWDGYWFWDNEKQTVMIYCNDGTKFDIRESQDVYYTLTNICRKDWCIYKIEK